MTTEKPGNPGSYKMSVLLIERDVCVTASSTVRTSNPTDVGSSRIRNLKLGRKLKKKKKNQKKKYKKKTKIKNIKKTYPYIKLKSKK